jgi:hypothetical protein
MRSPNWPPRVCFGSRVAQEANDDGSVRAVPNRQNVRPTRPAAYEGIGILRVSSVGFFRPARHLVALEPARLHDLFGELLVEVRSNELVKGVNEFSVLPPA